MKKNEEMNTKVNSRKHKRKPTVIMIVCKRKFKPSSHPSPTKSPFSNHSPSRPPASRQSVNRSVWYLNYSIPRKKNGYLFLNIHQALHQKKGNDISYTTSNHHPLFLPPLPFTPFCPSVLPFCFPHFTYDLYLPPCLSFSHTLSLSISLYIYLSLSLSYVPS